MQRRQNYSLSFLLSFIIKRIEEMPLDYIRDWLDGKNQLEWEGVAKTT